MKTPRVAMHLALTSIIGLAAIELIPSLSLAMDEPAPVIPTCAKKIGALAVKDPETNWWSAYQLESPAALIKVYVAQSKCFTLVDRGKGLEAAQAERALAASGEERVGSNIGKGR